VNVFGVPLSIYEPAEGGEAPPPPKPSTQIDVVPERAALELRWPNILRIEQVVKPFLAVDWSKVETLTLDPSTGAVLERTTFHDLPRPRRYRTALRFAHTGELWGPPGQTVAAVASLAAVGMVLTGLSLAIRRLAAFRGRRAMSAPPPSRTQAPRPRTR